MRTTLKDGTVVWQEIEKMEIETNLGTLVVEPVVAEPEADYPGVYISLKRPDGNVFTPFLVEVDQYDSNDVRMKAHYWSPESHFDDPVWDVALTAEEIDSTFKE